MFHGRVIEGLRKRPSPRVAYAGLYIGQYLFLGVQLPFFAGYLDARGISPEGIGLLFSVALVLRLALGPALAFQAEKFEDPRRGLIFATGGLALFGALTLIAPGKLFLGAAVVGLLFAFGLIVPLTDSAVLRADRRGELSYGPIRSIGSASFVGANLLGGAVISMGSDRAGVIWMALAAFLTLVLALRLPAEPDEGPGGRRPRPDMLKAFTLFRSRSFLYMLFAAGCVQGSHAVYYTFSELAFSAAGYPSWLIGVLWTIGVVGEIAFLIKGRPIIDKWGPVGLLFAGAISAVWRWPLMGAGLPLFLLAPLQLLHAGTFAATYMGSVEFVARAVPDEYRATAMTIVSTLGVGALTGFATIASGYVFAPAAPFYAYGMMGVLGVAGVVFTLLLRHRWDGGILGAVKDA